MKKTVPLFAFFAVAALIAISSHATVIQSDSEIDGSLNGNNAVVPTNLAESATLTSSDFTPANNGGISSIATLNNGSLGAGGDPSNNYNAQSFSPYTVTITLASSILGYDITGFTAVSGAYPDAINQNFTLSYSLVAAPGTFITLGTFTHNYTDVNFEPITLITALTGLDLTGVSGLQFTANAANGGATGAYRELEIFGSPTVAVPEPSTWAVTLISLGVLIEFQILRRLDSTHRFGNRCSFSQARGKPGMA